MPAGAIRHPKHTNRYDPEFLWYAPDRRIRTDEAAQEAKQLAARVVSESPGTYPVEDLFKALQTSAYRAARADRGRHITRSQRSQWAIRWMSIRDHIVEENLPLVRWLMTRYKAPDIDEDALFSEACLALVHAVERFNPWLGFRFSTYASTAIVRAMMRLRKRERRHKEVFSAQYDPSFERPADPERSDPQLHVERLNSILATNACELTRLETTVIAGRFGLRRHRRLTLQEIGDDVGLSKERIRQLQKAAMDKLRHALDGDPLLR